VVELPPRVVYVSPDTEGRQPRRREGVEDSYYLDWRRDVHPEPERPPERAREPQPEGLLLLARRQFRVESAEPGVYLVRWTGPAAEASLVEFQSLDKEGQVLHSRLLARAPFRCLLRVPVETASVVVTAEYREGLRTDLKLSVAEFKSLADRVDLPDRKSGTR
jgi:hypothetical protein